MGTMELELLIGSIERSFYFKGGLRCQPIHKKHHKESKRQSLFKGIVSPDWKGLQMVSLDRFEV
jgi:hypothetical protein